MPIRDGGLDVQGAVPSFTGGWVGGAAGSSLLRPGVPSSCTSTAASLNFTKLLTPSSPAPCTGPRHSLGSGETQGSKGASSNLHGVWGGGSLTIKGEQFFRPGGPLTQVPLLGEGPHCPGPALAPGA